MEFTMKFHSIISNILIILVTLVFISNGDRLTVRNDAPFGVESIRRILHQPLFPGGSSPLPLAPPSPAAPTGSSGYGSDQPFSPEVTSTGPSSTPYQTPPPPLSPSLETNGSGPIHASTQATKPTKKVAIVMSVAIVTLGMLSAFAFYLYRHKAKHSPESRKLVADESRAHPQPSSFLYNGTVEPANQILVTVSNDRMLNGSPYHKLNRPSPELQPLPPLSKAPPRRNDRPIISSGDEETRDNIFGTPNGSVASFDDGFWLPVFRSISDSSADYIPYSKRTSPKSLVFCSSPDVVKHTTNPPIKAAPPPPPPPPPRLPPRLPVMECQTEEKQETRTNMPVTVKSKMQPPPPPPPPPPNTILQKSIPPPPPPPRIGNGSSQTFPVTEKTQFQTPNSKESLKNNAVEELNEDDDEFSSSGRSKGDDTGNKKPKLKPLHWDKVRATSDRATVWDQLKSSSFQVNEEMMESLFGCNLSASVKKESPKKAIVTPAVKQHRVLDPKKSQNIAILLRALNVTKDEVAEALLDGNPEGLGGELFETLVKMAPTKEEEIKLKDYTGDISKLGAAERFLKAILDIPFAFKRVEVMLYRANFDAEVKYLTKSFQTLELAGGELKNSRLFFKLLEAVLQTGNRMNVGTNRGDAKAFKLDTLLKLVDIKGTDGKTTLLHFVVQEIIKSEGIKSQALPNEEEFKRHGLQNVSGLSRELGSVKAAAGMDSDVLSNYVTKLETGLEKVKIVLQHEKTLIKTKFFESMNVFIREAGDQIARVKAQERRTLSLVREVTEYFHGDTAKEDAHPIRVFLVVRDFLAILDNVCKEVGRVGDRSVMGTARSQPVITKCNLRREDSSGDET